MNVMIREYLTHQERALENAALGREVGIARSVSELDHMIQSAQAGNENYLGYFTENGKPLSFTEAKTLLK